MYTYFSRFSHHKQSHSDIKPQSSSMLSPSGLTRWSRSNQVANLPHLDTPIKSECDSLCTGRSMVEMLGVLAIIGVLSVGAIAGYSKAMEKWKINKNLTGYNHLIFGLMGYYNELHLLSPDSDDNMDKHHLKNMIKNLNLLPEGWTFTESTWEIEDFLKHQVDVFARYGNIVFDIKLSNDNSSNYTTRMCTELVNSLAKPLASDINFVWVFPSQNYFYGDKYCGGDKTCLSRTNLTQIEKACSSCVETGTCILVLEF